MFLRWLRHLPNQQLWKLVCKLATSHGTPSANNHNKTTSLSVDYSSKKMTESRRGLHPIVTKPVPKIWVPLPMPAPRYKSIHSLAWEHFPLFCDLLHIVCIIPASLTLAQTHQNWSQNIFITLEISLKILDVYLYTIYDAVLAVLYTALTVIVAGMYWQFIFKVNDTIRYTLACIGIGSGHTF
jgi:hypothetical protein